MINKLILIIDYNIIGRAVINIKIEKENKRKK